MLRPQARCAVASATCGKGGCVKCFDHIGRASAKTNMSATRGCYRLNTQIEPELRIFLPESDSTRSRFKSSDPNGGKQHVIEACRCCNVVYGDRNMINQAGASDFTSLKMMESINA